MKKQTILILVSVSVLLVVFFVMGNLVFEDNITGKAVFDKILEIFSGKGGKTRQLDTPQLISPGNNTVANSMPTFSWNRVGSANSYNLQVTSAQDTNFFSPIINVSVSGVQYITPEPLDEGHYLWRVMAKSKNSVSGWSGVFAFTIPPITPGPSFRFMDDFSNYTTETCFSSGSMFGQWTMVFSGFGCVKVENFENNRVLHQFPMRSTSAGETHSSLVVGPIFQDPLNLILNLTTIEQLRTGSNPNPWEVAWVIWHYTDNSHFYYFIPKPNGWELGKRDPAYPGGQRFLATGSSPAFPIGQEYEVEINQRSNPDGSVTMDIYVNGQFIRSFTDTQNPYRSGKIGLYNEDAHVHFDDVLVI